MNETKTPDVPENVASALCYSLGFVSGIVALILEKQRETVRYHAMQSVLVFGGLYIANYAFYFVPGAAYIAAPLTTPLTLGVWLFFILKAYLEASWKPRALAPLVQKALNSLKPVPQQGDKS